MCLVISVGIGKEVSNPTWHKTNNQTTLVMYMCNCVDVITAFLKPNKASQ